MTANPRLVSGSLTSTGSTDVIYLEEGNTIDIQVSGTFAATWGITQSIDDGATFGAALADNEGTTSFTAPNTLTFTANCTCQIRVTCSAYTSGTLTVRMRR